uniref:DnaJ homolog subfamily C member 30, mitochondrial n=1 Tax=Oncorhynchus kisutch TaxID=8019 RepID=A0A8C7MXT1_ONCKI
MCISESVRSDRGSRDDQGCSLDSASRWFYLSSPHLADTQVHVIASRASSWIRNGLVTATITQTRREQRRSLCMVRFAIGQSSFSLRQSHEQLFPLYKSRTAYYEILQVSPTATQAQIKTAYYKQSFVYHPDKNAGSEEATNRFSNISEAYNVLGNKGLRKKYDRGILSQGDVTGASKPSAKDTKSSSSQPTREARQTSALGIDSKNIFDFDNFIKSHYKSQLMREEELRVRKEEIMRKKEAIKDQEMGKMMEMAVGVLVIIAVCEK